MFYLILHKFVEGTGTMGPDGGDGDYVEYNLPLDLLGPYEIHPKGSLLYLRNNMGYVIIKETTEQIRGQLAEMFAEIARQNNG